MYYLGVDLGGTNIAVGIVSVYGKLLFKHSRKTEADKGYEKVIDNIVGCIEETVENYQINISNISAIGIGSPGLIDSGNGLVISAFNIKGMQNIYLADEIQKRINTNVYISNDANCAALGEAVAGTAKGLKDVVMITLGTGVGGGIIINGRLYEGGQSRGAELGHILVDPNGPVCSCGRKGCWEAMASATALIRETKTAIDKNPDSLLAEMAGERDNVSGRTAFDADRAGCPVAHEVVAQYARYVAEGIIDIVNIFRPEIVLLGGGISNEGENLLAPVREYVSKNCFANELISCPRIERASLGNDAGIIGSAMLARFTPSGEIKL